jgi:hypothetical protein
MAIQCRRVTCLIVADSTTRSLPDSLIPDGDRLRTMSLRVPPSASGTLYECTTMPADLFFYDYSARGAFPGGLADRIFQMGRHHVNENRGEHLILVILEDIRAHFVAIPVAHTQIVIDFDFHFSPSLIRKKCGKFAKLSILKKIYHIATDGNR